MLSPLSNDQQMSPLSTPGSVYPWQKLEEREFDEIHSLVYTEINSWKTPERKAIRECQEIKTRPGPLAVKL